MTEQPNVVLIHRAFAASIDRSRSADRGRPIGRRGNTGLTGEPLHERGRI
jgi:hypothetical protein